MRRQGIEIYYVNLIRSGGQYGRGRKCGMRLVIGGSWQGKREYVKRKYGLEDAQIWQGTSPSLPPGTAAIYGLHNIIRRMLSESGTEKEPERYVLGRVREWVRLCPDCILICDEVGGGIVPVKREERDYRECVGRVLCELAREADSVERVYCGVGQTIKRTVLVALLRHGATESNLRGRYLGVTDEPLSEEGIAALRERRQEGLYPPVARVVTSPLCRCRQTAQILYPDISGEVVQELRETDFGLFEGKNHGELMADERLRETYQAWIDSGGRLPFPEGESMEQSMRRCGRAFEQLLPTLTDSTALIVHGGTIMGILGTHILPRRDYFDYRCDNGTGYLCRVELTGDGALYRMEIARRLG